MNISLGLTGPSISSLLIYVVEENKIQQAISVKSFLHLLVLVLSLVIGFLTIKFVDVVDMFDIGAIFYICGVLLVIAAILIKITWISTIEPKENEEINSSILLDIKRGILYFFGNKPFWNIAFIGHYNFLKSSNIN